MFDLVRQSNIRLSSIDFDISIVIFCSVAFNQHWDFFLCNKGLLHIMVTVNYKANFRLQCIWTILGITWNKVTCKIENYLLAKMAQSIRRFHVKAPEDSFLNLQSKSSNLLLLFDGPGTLSPFFTLKLISFNIGDRPGKRNCSFSTRNSSKLVITAAGESSSSS